MLFNTLVFSALATSTLAFPFNVEQRSAGYGRRAPRDPAANLPACGPDTVTCKCPAGSIYQTSSSYAFWPVPAKEITNLTIDFLDTAWFGTSPNSTEGKGTVVGAKRHLFAQLPGSSKVDLITEELTGLTRYQDGGYYMKFQMADAPFYYPKDDGSKGLLAGSWDIVDVRNINGVAYMLWDIHVCFMDVYGE